MCNENRAEPYLRNGGASGPAFTSENFVFRSEAWWTRTQRIRTVAAVPLEVPILEVKLPPVYQRIAQKAKHLRELGMTYPEIGEKLGVDRWAVGKAVRWFGGINRD